jgi:predicted protein tyrosine phosphatase
VKVIKKLKVHELISKDNQMHKNVMFTNKGTAENNVGMPNWAVISISELTEAKIKQGWYALHRSNFHDVDPAKRCDEPHILMNEKHAIEIVDYVFAVTPHIDGMLVHCKGGISRSAAVAKWIAETFNLPFDHQYSLYNKHVYRRLVGAYERRKRRPQ